MLRRLFTLTSALSLLLFIPMTGLWVRSYSIKSGVQYIRSFQNGSWVDRRLFFAQGKLWLRGISGVSDHWYPLKIKVRQWPLRYPASPNLPNYVYVDTGQHFAFLGAHVDIYGEKDMNQRAVAIPLWIITAVWIPVSSLLLIQIFLTRSRNRGGICSSCGYDLRASKDRCPECGTAIPLASVKTT
jgi:hypothetical protein